MVPLPEEYTYEYFLTGPADTSKATVTCLLPNGIVICLNTKYDITLGELKEDVWLAAQAQPLNGFLHDMSTYIIMFVNSMAQMEEVTDENRKLCDIKPTGAVLKIVESNQQKVDVDHSLNVQISHLIGKHKTKAMWNLVKQVIKPNAKQNTIDLEATCHKYNLKDDQNVADYINNFFLTLYNSVSNDTADCKYVKYTNRTCFLSPTNTTEVYNTIMSLKNTASVGFDEVPVAILKRVALSIVSPLTHIINMVFENAIFPDTLKIAIIKPICKKGEKGDLSNYRPIALLLNISKIFEKIVLVRLVNFLDEQGILNGKQNA